MSNYGAVALSEGMQGPTFSKLGSEISSARSADVTMGSSLSSGQGMLILFADMKESLIAIQKNTLQTTELLKTAIFGTPGQQTAEAVAGGETDDDSDDDENNEKRPGILARTGASIKGAAKAFLGSTLGKLLLVGGVLTLLQLFGEKLVNPLANLIETIKRGDLSKKINELKEALKTTAMEAFEALKTKVEEMIQIVIDVKNKIVEYVDKLKLMFDPLLDYIDSFDVDGDGVLDAEERRNLKLSIQEKIKDFIYDTIGETLLAVGSVFGLVTAANIMTRIATIPGTKGAGLGLMGTAALVAMAAAGIYKLYNAVNFALDEALDKETGNIETTQFIASLMAGRNPEGGLGNAAINTFDKGLIGLSVGAIIGFLIGGPGGAIVGARIGAMAGSVIGAITGYAGSDEMKDTMDKMQSTIADSIDSITSTILGVPSKYDMDIPRLTEEKKAVDEALEVAQNATYKDETLISDLTAQSKDLQGRIDRAPDLIQQMRGINVEDMTKDIKSNEKKIAYAKEQLAKNNLFPVDPKTFFHQVRYGQFPAGDLGSEKFKEQFGHGLKNAFQLPFDEQILYYTNMNQLLEANRAKVISEKNANEAPGNLTIGNLSNYKPNKTFSLQDTKPLMESLTNITPTSGYAEKMQSMVVNSGNDNSIKQNNETFLTGNLVSGRPEGSAKLLSSRAIGVPGTFF